MRGFFKGMILSGWALLAAGQIQEARAAQLPVVPSEGFARAAAAAPLGSRLRLEGVEVEGEAPAAFELERFQVFAGDAEIVVHGRNGDRKLPVPANAYFRGVVAGRPDSRVFLAQLANGATQGVVSEPGATYLIGGDDAPAKTLGGPLVMRPVDPQLLKSSRGPAACGNVDLPPGPGNEPLGDLGAAATALPALPAKDTAGAALTAARTARLAIETDYEFYALFNDPTLAANYAATLVGYTSTVYSAELGTSLILQSLSLWQTSDDPWTQRNPLCSLLEFGKYWNQNRTGVSRTVAHFLSGRVTGGGLSWVGALCNGPFTTGRLNCPELGAETTPWGGDYGFTGNLYGEFSLANPVVVWDSYAFAHELGHNFGSPHSHCYNGYGGSPDPIDQCYGGEAGCYSGATSLPGPAKMGTGTLMSYCHMLSGMYQNISMSFGTNFPWGVQPGREAARINAYLAAVASANSSCLGTAAALPQDIFKDNFESGNLTFWH